MPARQTSLARLSRSSADSLRRRQQAEEEEGEGEEREGEVEDIAVPVRLLCRNLS